VAYIWIFTNRLSSDLLGLYVNKFLLLSCTKKKKEKMNHSIGTDVRVKNYVNFPFFGYSKYRKK
jgi:hypothetical protein